MSRDVLHVVPQADQWAVKHEGVEKVDSTHSTQKEAIDAAREKANDGDSIVIHRADGTIRGRLTYTEDSNGSTNRISGTGNGSRSDRDDRAERKETIKPHDVMSVGTRLSWNAVLAGAVVTIAVYATLMALAGAVGITARDQFHANPTTFALIATGIAMFCLLVSLFLGGFVVSRITVGEDKTEALIYGLVLWGTIFTFAMVAGAQMGVNLGQAYGNVVLAQKASDTASNKLLPGAQSSQKPGNHPLSPAAGDQSKTPDQQKTETAAQQVADDASRVDPAVPAWVGFAGLILSILASILGAIEGAGPELVFAQLRDRHGWMRRRVVLAPAGNTTDGSGARMVKV